MFRNVFHLACLLICLVLVSCRPDRSEPTLTVAVPAATAPPNISETTAATPAVPLDVYDTLVVAGRYTHFVQMIDFAGLEGILRTRSAITVFAFPDTVFESLAADTAADLLGNEAAIMRVMQRHIATIDLDGATIRRASICCDVWDAVGTLGGESLHYGLDAHSQPVVDGIRLSGTEIEAANGRIHEVAAIIFPYGTHWRPYRVYASIPWHIGSYSRFSDAAAWLIGGPYNAEAWTSRLARSLSGAGPYTLFIPSNNAFAEFEAAYNTQLVDSISLQRFLYYHALKNIYFDQTAAPLTTDMTLSGERISLAFVDEGQLNVNGQEVKIWQTMAASNGIVYLVDSIFLPPGIDVEHLPAGTLWTLLEADERFAVFRNLDGMATWNDEQKMIIGYPLYADELTYWGPYTVVAPTNAAWPEVEFDQAGNLIHESFAAAPELDIDDYLFEGIRLPDAPELSRFEIVETITATNGVIYVVEALPVDELGGGRE